MKKLLQIAYAGLLAGGMLLGGGCAVYAPDGGYAYDYYPDTDVYFYPAGGYYYWNDGGRWYHGRNLPAHYTINVQNRQSMQFHTTHPWTENHEAARPSGGGHPVGGSGGSHGDDHH